MLSHLWYRGLLDPDDCTSIALCLNGEKTRPRAECAASSAGRAPVGGDLDEDLKHQGRSPNECALAVLWNKFRSETDAYLDLGCVCYPMELFAIKNRREILTVRPGHGSLLPNFRAFLHVHVEESIISPTKGSSTLSCLEPKRDVMDEEIRRIIDSGK